MNFVKILILFLCVVFLSGCATLEKWRKEREERIRRELIELREINPRLADMYESKIAPMADDDFRSDSSTFDADAAYDLKNKSVDIHWSNTAVSYGYRVNFNGKKRSVFRSDFDEKKFNRAKQYLLSAYKNLLEKEKGVVLKKDAEKYSDTAIRESLEDYDSRCIIKEAYIAYMGDEIDSALLTYLCKSPTILHPKIAGVFAGSTDTQMGVRILDGSLIDD